MVFILFALSCWVLSTLVKPASNSTKANQVEKSIQPVEITRLETHPTAPAASLPDASISLPPLSPDGLRNLNSALLSWGETPLTDSKTISSSTVPADGKPHN